MAKSSSSSKTPKAAARPKAPKIQRWVDLVAALLRRHFPVAFEDLVREVPSYQSAGSKPTLRRMFERDKDELRAFGIPIRTVKDGAGEVVGYQLQAKEFYLPYLSVVLDGRRSTPRRVNRHGYRALLDLAFEPDELRVVVEAAARVGQLGDPVLAEHARSAVRKLACDLPVDSLRADEPGVLVAPQAKPDPAVFARLGEALERRKRVRFDYYAIGSDTVARRSAEPYGLFFLGQHWYLAAREGDGAIVKNFRLSRMRNVVTSAEQPGTPDYEIPASFHLREHARSRQAWELGDGDSVLAVVEFRQPTGAATAAARLGQPVADQPTYRAFQVRRPEAFALWLLSLGDAVAPIAPASLRQEYVRQVAATLALYAEPCRDPS